MYIQKHMTHPNGAVTSVHRISQLLIESGGPLNLQHAAYVVVTVSSVADSNSHIIFHQERLEMPLAALNADLYPDNVFAFLTGVDGYLQGGVATFEDLDALPREKLLKKQQVDEWRRIKTHGGLEIPDFGTFDTDETSIRNIQGEVAIATQAVLANDTDWRTNWRLKDNTTLEMTAADTIAVGKAFRDHVTACYVRSWVLKAQIEAASTLIELYAVNIALGWPGDTPEINDDDPE